MRKYISDGYLIDENGIVICLGKSVFINRKQTTKEHIVRLYFNKKNKYFYVPLKDGGENKLILLHRLMWETFVGKIPKGYEIDHIDGDRTNNRLDNLRCVTHQENCNNPVTNERYKKSNKGKSNNTQKKIIQLSLDGEFIKEYDSISSVSKFGFDRSRVSQCCNGKKVQHKKFKWKFVDDKN